MVCHIDVLRYIPQAHKQVLSLIGADPGGGELPYTVLDSGMNGAAGESGDGVAGPGAGLGVHPEP